MKKALFNKWYNDNKDSDILAFKDKKEAKKIFSSVYESVMTETNRRLLFVKSTLGNHLHTLENQMKSCADEIEHAQKERNSLIDVMSRIYDETADKKNENASKTMKRYLGNKLFSSRERLRYLENLMSRLKDNYRMTSSLLR